jgi:hypothetical protein
VVVLLWPLAANAQSENPAEMLEALGTPDMSFLLTPGEPSARDMALARVRETIKRMVMSGKLRSLQTLERAETEITGLEKSSASTEDILAFATVLSCLEESGTENEGQTLYDVLKIVGTIGDNKKALTGDTEKAVSRVTEAVREEQRSKLAQSLSRAPMGGAASQRFSGYLPPWDS